MQDRERYDRALARAQDLRSFYLTLVLYVVVNAMLFIVDMATGGHTWFYWPLLGWGIGMVIWAIYLFGIGNRFGDDWVDRKARQIMDREQQGR